MFCSEKLSSETGNIISALGTWIYGDHSPHPTIAMYSAGIGFIITYFLTVLIESKYLKWTLNKTGFPIDFNVLKQAYIFNAISYGGLIITFVVLTILGELIE